MTPTQRLQNIDALRGIASLSICVLHLGTDQLFPPEFVLVRLLYHNPFNVLVFRIISGYVIIQSLADQQYQWRNLGSFLKRRYVRLEPAFILSVLLVVFLNYLSSTASNYAGSAFQLNFPVIVTNLVHLNSLFDYPFLNASYWTLFVEWQFYLLIGLAAPSFLKASPTQQSIGLVLLSSLGIFTDNHLSVFHDGSLFALGILAWQRHRTPITASTFWWTFFALVCISAYTHRSDLVHLLGVLFAFFVVVFRLSFRFPRFLGQISYALFLTHLPIGTRFTHLTSRYYTSLESRLLILMLGVLLCIAFAYLFHYTVEKFFQKKFKHVLFRTLYLA
ncbi:acyltransferase family protein [Siphonobacter sp.]|uniref:acyltransferase family protein n=1 Tax=Siphonobacter sp. TaxID=1869184 RepID=UPI003B3A6014